MKKVFLSQPFHGRSEQEIFRERYEIAWNIQALFDEKFEIIDQYHQDAPVIHPRFYHLSRDILLMDQADIIIFAPGWENAKGCRVEHELALVYEMNAYEYESGEKPSIYPISLMKG